MHNNFQNVVQVTSKTNNRLRKYTATNAECMLQFFRCQFLVDKSQAFEQIKLFSGCKTSSCLKFTMLKIIERVISSGLIITIFYSYSMVFCGHKLLVPQNKHKSRILFNYMHTSK